MTSNVEVPTIVITEPERQTHLIPTSVFQSTPELECTECTVSDFSPKHVLGKWGYSMKETLYIYIVDPKHHGLVCWVVWP